MSKNKNVLATLKTIGTMTVIVMIGKVLGLARQILISAQYGTNTAEIKAFNAASIIPNSFLDVIFASALSASFIPVFNEVLEKKGKDKALKFSSNFSNIIFLASSFITIISMLFANNLIAFFADGFADQFTISLSVKILRILFPTVVFSSLAFTFTGILQSLGEFRIPSALSIISNIVIILYLIFFDKDYGIIGLAYVFLFAWFLQLLIQIPKLRSFGYRKQFSIDFKDGNLVQVFRLSAPVMISTWLVPINLLMSNRFATRLFDGAGSPALYNSNQIFTIVVGVITLAVTNLIFPNLSRLNASNDHDKFASLIRVSMKSLLYVLVPLSVGLFILSEPLVRIMFQYNNFDVNSTLITAKALRFYAFGVIGYGLLSILNRGFYAFRDGKTLIFASLIGILTNYVLSYFLAKYMDVGGLTLAMSISMIIYSAILILIMRKKFKDIINTDTIVEVLKMVFAALVMGAVVAFASSSFSKFLGDSFMNRLALLFIPTILGILAYYFTTLVLKIEEAVIIKNLFKRNR